MSGCTELIEISDRRRIEECRSAGPLERPEPGGLLRQFVLQELVNERFLARDATQQK